MESPIFTVINGLVDFCFFIDIIVTFRTTFVDQKTGDEVFDFWEIAKIYLSGRFWIDLLSTVPLDQVATIFLPPAQAKNFQLFGVLKLMRVLRLSRIITYLNVVEDVKMVSIFVV